jgi:hypothetical protein
VPSPNPGGTRGVSVLNGVAAASAANAWAVGYYAPRGSPLRTLIVHWTGTAWKQVPSHLGSHQSQTGSPIQPASRC